MVHLMSFVCTLHTIDILLRASLHRYLKKIIAWTFLKNQWACNKKYKKHCHLPCYWMFLLKTTVYWDYLRKILCTRKASLFSLNIDPVENAKFSSVFYAPLIKLKRPTPMESLQMSFCVALQCLRTNEIR